MSLTDGQKALREHIVCNGSGDRSVLDALIKAQSGDMVFKVTPSTATQAAGNTGFTKNFDITLESAAGEVNQWYNGSVTIAVAETSAAGSASIVPAAGTHNMVDGKLTVAFTGAAAWVAGEKATLTVDAGTILGYPVASKTGVVTIV
jgi:hypothetical protein